MAMDNPAVAPRLTRWQRFRESVDIWHISAASGLFAAAAAWTIWYFSKIPCTMELAHAGACNPNALANLITLPALTSILAIGAGVATLAGGYSYAMVSKANRRADEAELRLQQERQRGDAERQLDRERNDAERRAERERNAQLMEEMRAELSAQRQQADAQRQQAVAQQQQAVAQQQQAVAQQQQAVAQQQQTAETTQQLIQQMLEERSQSAAIQQAMMTTLSEMNAHLARMAEQHQNGRRNDDG